MTSKAIVVTETGGPEVMKWVDVEIGQPGPDEVRVRNHAVGLNFIDVYFRTGAYAQPLPAGLGMEGAGVVEAVGQGVTHVRVGDRVAYAGKPNGAYAQVRIMPAKILVRLPNSLSFEQGAAMMLQGLTAQYLLKRTYRVQSGDTIVLHAAAGGVGLFVCQWAKALGVKTIGTVSNAKKAALAKANGCDVTVVLGQQNLVDVVKEHTNGEGVPVVYDSIGKDTFLTSLDCLRPLGMMVSFGGSSGPLPPFESSLLAAKGSLFFTRPTLMTYTDKREDLDQMAAELFNIVASGKVKIQINQRYELANVAQAHRDLESRKTTGSTLLIP